jgi:hypothetical protein
MAPVRAERVEPDGAIAETTTSADARDDLGALNQKMNSLFVYGEMIDFEFTGWGPVRDTGSAVFEFAILYDGSDRDLEFTFDGQYVTVTAQIQGDGGGSASNNASIGTPGSNSFTVAVGGLTVTNYIKGQINITANPSAQELWGLQIRQKSATADITSGSEKTCGYIPTDDVVFRGGDDPLDAFILNRLGGNIKALMKANANRGGKLYKSSDPDESDTNKDQTLPHVVGSRDWRVDGPYEFVASDLEETCDMIVAVEDGGAGYSKDVILSVIGAGETMVHGGGPWDRRTHVTGSGTQYVRFTDIPVKPGGVTHIWLLFMAPPETSAVEIAESSPSNIWQAVAGVWHSDDANADFSGDATVFYAVPNKWSVDVKANTNYLPSSWDLSTAAVKMDVAHYRESNTAFEGWTATPGSASHSLPGGGTAWQAGDGAKEITGLTVRKFARNYLVIKSVHMLANPVDLDLLIQHNRRASSGKVRELFELTSKISQTNVPTIACRQHGSVNQIRDIDKNVNGQVSADYIGFGPWTVVTTDAFALGAPDAHDGWSYASEIPAAFYVVKPYQHSQNPGTEYKEAPRKAWGTLVCAFYMPTGNSPIGELRMKHRLAYYIGGSSMPTALSEYPDYYGPTSITALTDDQLVRKAALMGDDDTNYDIAHSCWAVTGQVWDATVGFITAKPSFFMQALLARDAVANRTKLVEIGPMEFDLTQIGTSEFPGFFVVEFQEDVPTDGVRMNPVAVVLGGFIRFGGRDTAL